MADKTIFIISNHMPHKQENVTWNCRRVTMS